MTARSAALLPRGEGEAAPRAAFLRARGESGSGRIAVGTRAATCSAQKGGAAGSAAGAGRWPPGPIPISRSSPGEPSIKIDAAAGDRERGLRAALRGALQGGGHGQRGPHDPRGGKCPVEDAGGAAALQPFHPGLLEGAGDAADRALPLHAHRVRPAARLDMCGLYFEEVAGMDRHKAASLARSAGGSIAAGLFWTDDENYGMRRRIAELLAGQQRARPQGHPSLAERMAAKGREMEYLSFLLDIFQGRLVAPQDGRASGLRQRGPRRHSHGEGTRRCAGGWMRPSRW